MGGATPAYGIGTEKEGVDLAGDLWDTFGGGSGTIRPFGNASVDGFDLDIENGEKAGYTAFSKRIRELYGMYTRHLCYYFLLNFEYRDG
jgi:chitinase